MKFIPSSKTNPISRSEERGLIRKAQAGDRRAADRLLNANYRFVVQCATHFRFSKLPMEDLVNEGLIGLHRAIQSFDPDRGLKFISYGVWWIRRMMQTAVWAQAFPVHVPANLFQKTKDQTKAAREANAEIVRTISSSISFESLAQNGYDKPSTDLLASEVLEASSTRSMIERILESMDERHAFVIRERFGFRDDGAQTLLQVAEKMQISRERVRQIEALALSIFTKKINQLGIKKI